MIFNCSVMRPFDVPCTKLNFSMQNFRERTLSLNQNEALDFRLSKKTYSQLL